MRDRGCQNRSTIPRCTSILQTTRFRIREFDGFPPKIKLCGISSRNCLFLIYTQPLILRMQRRKLELALSDYLLKLKWNQSVFSALLSFPFMFYLSLFPKHDLQQLIRYKQNFSVSLFKRWFGCRIIKGESTPLSSS